MIPQFYYELIENDIPKITEPKLNNGDIIMFKYDTPVLYFKDGKRNSSLYLGKAIQNSLSFWFHNNSYTHAGIAFNGKILHLNSDPYYDHMTKKWVVGSSPVLSTIEDMYAIPTIMHLYRVKHTPKNQNITIPNVKIRNDVIDALIEHVGRVTVDDEYYSCTRFVDEIQYKMKIKNYLNKFADLKTVIEDGYESPILIETPWSKSRGF